MPVKMTPTLTRRGVAALATLLVLTLAPSVRPLWAQQLKRDVLAGHVTGPSGDPVPGAQVGVLAVGAPADARPQVARTDIEGRWLLAVQEGPGTYVVRVQALGMQPAVDTARRGAE